QSRDSLEVRISLLEVGANIHVVGRGIPIAVVVKAGESQALKPPIRTEWVGAKARHYFFVLALLKCVEVGVIIHTEAIIEIICFTASQLNRPFHLKSELARREAQIVPRHQIDEAVAIEVFLPRDERIWQRPE